MAAPSEPDHGGALPDSPAAASSGAGAPGGRCDGYAPLRDYGAIGDGRTLALVARDGAVDWLCLPDLDSPSVFAALLDSGGGGRFALAPAVPFGAERRYLPATNVLETTFTTATGVVRVTDAMSLPIVGLAPGRELVRRVEGLAGQVPIRWSVQPRFGYGAWRTRIGRRHEVPVISARSDAAAICSWDAGDPQSRDDCVHGRFTALEGSRSLIALSVAHGEPLLLPARAEVEARLAATIEFWRGWATGRRYDGAWRDAVLRSALALKLLICRGDLSQAMAREAAAQHFLTDAFTAGHMRTPVAQIRRFWRWRYPDFWSSLQRRVAVDTAATLRELAWALRRLPERFLHDATVSAIQRRTSRYPVLSIGDFLARLFHDWDNSHGLAIDAGGRVFGDGHVDQGVTRTLALAAVRAGIDDIEAAFELGARGTRLTGEQLYRAVRAATGAPQDTFLAETKIPRPAVVNPPQNWRATDIETLWETPIVGSTGTTVGQALTAMMHPDGYFIRQLDRLGQGLVDAHGLLAVPILGDWLARKGRDAYHRGFVEPLAAQPRQAIFSVVHANITAEAATKSSSAGQAATPCIAVRSQ